MTNTEELERLRISPTTKPEELGIVRILAYCSDNAQFVLNRCKEVLEIVLKQNFSNWPSSEEWYLLLPQWFVTKCSKEMSNEETEEWLRWWRKLSPEEQERVTENTQWSVPDWIHWFQPEERQWFWWDATILDLNHILIEIEVKGWPFPWGSLKWLLKASGVIEVKPEIDI